MTSRASHSPMDSDDGRPTKRARHSPGPPGSTNGNGHSSDTMPPLSLSILGVEPLDEFTMEVADFIHHHIVNRPPGMNGHVEVEAKLGVLMGRGTDSRIRIPVTTETVLDAGYNAETRFDANMSMQQHKHFNMLLNDLKTGAHQRPPGSTEISYAHLHLKDSFYEGEHRSEKIRVTRDERTGEVVETLRKVRLGDLNIFCPKRACDWRVSVNVEIPVEHPVGTPTHTRKKDRISYSHEELRIDLTQVTSQQGGPSGPTEVTHELEIELARPALLMELAAKRGNGSLPELERDAFNELIRAFVNNARILVRNADG
ncbi:mRNA triphosphatase CET1 [Peniophora sp. CONT]|nr:mRNA triphosphatase CET1 [Peniophora sp. CONT]